MTIRLFSFFCLFIYFFLSRVTITPDGVEAVMRLGQGDMRRVLNLLQSTHMAYQKVKGGIPNTTSVVAEKRVLLIESGDENKV